MKKLSEPDLLNLLQNLQVDLSIGKYKNLFRLIRLYIAEDLDDAQAFALAGEKDRSVASVISIHSFEKILSLSDLDVLDSLIRAAR